MGRGGARTASRYGAGALCVSGVESEFGWGFFRVVPVCCCWWWLSSVLRTEIVCSPRRISAKSVLLTKSGCEAANELVRVILSNALMIDRAQLLGSEVGVSSVVTLVTYSNVKFDRCSAVFSHGGSGRGAVPSAFVDGPGVGMIRGRMQAENTATTRETELNPDPFADRPNARRSFHKPRRRGMQVYHSATMLPWRLRLLSRFRTCVTERNYRDLMSRLG